MYKMAIIVFSQQKVVTLTTYRGLSQPWHQDQRRSCLCGM